MVGMAWCWQLSLFAIAHLLLPSSIFRLPAGLCAIVSVILSVARGLVLAGRKSVKSVTSFPCEPFDSVGDANWIAEWVRMRLYSIELSLRQCFSKPESLAISYRVDP